MGVRHYRHEGGKNKINKHHTSKKRGELVSDSNQVEELWTHGLESVQRAGERRVCQLEQAFELATGHLVEHWPREHDRIAGHRVEAQRQRELLWHVMGPHPATYRHQGRDVRR